MTDRAFQSNSWTGILSGKNRSRIRWLIVLTVLAGSIFAGIFGSPERSAFALLLAGAAIFGWVFLRWPILGVFSIVVVGLLIPINLPTGTRTFVPPTFLIIPISLCGVILARTQEEDAGLVLPRQALPITLLAGFSLFSFGAGQLIRLPFTQQAPMAAQLGALSVFMIAAMAFILSAWALESPSQLKSLTWVSLASMALYVVPRYIPFGGRQFLSVLPGPADGSVMWVWLVAIAASQALLNRRLNPVLRALLLCLVGLSFYQNLFLGRSWASGWVPSLAAFVVILWLSFPRLGWAASPLAGTLVALNWPRIANILLVEDNSYSLVTRMEAWDIVLDLSRKSPIFGLGPANYYWYTPNFPIRGFYVQFSSHNNYVDLVAQTGVLGLLLFLWFAWTMARTLWQLLDRPRLDEFERAYVVGAVGGLVGMLVSGMLGDWVLPFVYNIGLNGMRASLIGWMFLGAGIALHRMHAQSHQVSESE